MTWTQHVNNTDWKIDSNAYYYINYSFYRWEKSFIKITMKTAGEKTISVNGENYTLYSVNEYIIIEITDYVRLVSSGTMTFIAGVYNNSFNFVSVNGNRNITYEDEKITGDIFYIPTKPFYVQFLGQRTDYYTTSGTYSALNSAGANGSYNVSSLSPAFNKVIRYYDGPVPTGETINFIVPSCLTKYTLVQWLGRSALMKSWVFEIKSVIHFSDKTLNLQTLENGYYVYKNKRENVVVKHSLANTRIQHYLSDLVFSDEVYIDGVRAKVADNAFEVTQQKRDIQLTINKYAYDTI